MQKIVSNYLPCCLTSGLRTLPPSPQIQYRFQMASWWAYIAFDKSGVCMFLFLCLNYRLLQGYNASKTPDVHEQRSQTRIAGLPNFCSWMYLMALQWTNITCDVTFLQVKSRNMMMTEIWFTALRAWRSLRWRCRWSLSSCEAMAVYLEVSHATFACWRAHCNPFVACRFLRDCKLLSTSMFLRSSSKLLTLTETLLLFEWTKFAFCSLWSASKISYEMLCVLHSCVSSIRRQNQMCMIKFKLQLELQQ